MSESGKFVIDVMAVTSSYSTILVHQECYRASGGLNCAHYMAELAWTEDIKHMICALCTEDLWEIPK